ncbi:RHS repeat-associated core domain-containing protein, partial [Prosthecobacter debontii]
GMWLSRDPAGFVDGPNLYAYVKQNPWTAWDPEGLLAFQTHNPHAAWNPEIKKITESRDYQQSYWNTAQAGALAFLIAPVVVAAAYAGPVVVAKEVGDEAFDQAFEHVTGFPAPPTSITDLGQKLLKEGGEKITKDVGGQSVKRLKEQADKLAKKLEDRKQNALRQSDPNTNPRQRGRDNERKVLEDRGDQKNTETFSTSHGDTIPDFNNATQMGDVKDVKTLSNTAQMKAQREAAAAQGKEHVVVTGDKTNITTPMLQSGSKFERRSDIGPK